MSLSERKWVRDMMKPYSNVSTLCLEKTNNRNLVYHIPIFCAPMCVCLCDEYNIMTV